jgi:hypothetical protein
VGRPLDPFHPGWRSTRKRLPERSKVELKMDSQKWIHEKGFTKRDSQKGIHKNGFTKMDSQNGLIKVG